MQIGTPQGSPLSPVLWLIFIAIILKKADQNLEQLCASPYARSHRRGYPHPLHSQSSFRILLFSYADDVNPLIISHNLTDKGHADLVNQADKILDKEADNANVSWDKDKHTTLHFNKDSRPVTYTKTLGLTIASDLSWTTHIKSRLQKGKAAWHVMKHLGNAYGGMSHMALRSLYTGKIRPIVLWGAEFWYTSPLSVPHELSSLEYKALRKICGGYHGSSHFKLGAIAKVEPLHIKISDMLVNAIQRLTRHADPLFTELLHSPTISQPHDPPFLDPLIGTYPYPGRDSALSYAIAETGLDSPEQLSLGNSEDRTSPPIIDDRIFDLQDARSNSKAYWSAALAQRRHHGFRMVDRRLRKRRTRGGGSLFYGHKRKRGQGVRILLGHTSTPLDAELQAINIALATESSATILIISDTLSALQTILALSNGSPPGSAIEARIKDLLHHRHALHHDTAITWVRAHIGIEGNERADRIAAFNGTLGQLNGSPSVVTPGGLRAASKAIRKSYRTPPSFGNANSC